MPLRPNRLSSDRSPSKQWGEHCTASRITPSRLPSGLMNITSYWINEYLAQDLSVDELIAALERAGFPCEERTELPDGDTFLDIEITSNRGDCVSVVGLAREVAAATGITLTPPSTDIPSEYRDESAAAADVTSVAVEDQELCPYFTAQMIKGVKVAPSPDWLRTRLEAVGLRAVNNVVDITNYVLFELGQPLHAYDAARLDEGRLVVRRATKGETLISIDESNLKLDDPMLAIADAHKPVGLGGVMGGLNTEVSEQTVDILLEAATFNAMSVRTTSRKLKLFSDASYRFERGVHPATVAASATRAAALIAEIAGGKVLAGIIEAGAPIPELIQVSMRPARCRKLAGAEISNDEMIERLESLGLAPQLKTTGNDADDSIQCTIPPHRLDLTREVDLIEEIIRLHGFDNLIPNTKISIEVVGPQPEITNRVAVEETLAALGFYEIVTHSFISAKHAKPFLPEGFEMLRVGDDRRKAEPILRPSILPSLLACRKRNQDAGHRNVRLFEQSACFGLKDGEKLENTNLAFIVDAPDKQQGLREVRAAIDAVVRTVVGSTESLIVRPLDVKWYEGTAGAVLMLGDTVLGTMGLINQSIQNDHDLRTPIVAAELGLAQHYSTVPEPAYLSEFSTYPAIQRDLSIIIDEEIAWSKIAEVIAQVEVELIESTDFVGVYRGKQVGAGKKSLTINFTFRAPDRTLRHEEVDPQMQAFVDHLIKETGAELRVN